MVGLRNVVEYVEEFSNLGAFVKKKDVHLKGIGKKQGVWIGGEEDTVCSGL